jgi:hypothetical protein
VTEFTIDIETIEGTASEEETVARVAEGLQAGAALDPSASLNTRTGVVAATFQLQAENLQGAVDLAIELFARALEAAGTVPEAGWVNAEEVGSLTVAPTRDRELVGA